MKSESGFSSAIASQPLRTGSFWNCQCTFQFYRQICNHLASWIRRNWEYLKENLVTLWMIVSFSKTFWVKDDQISPHTCERSPSSPSWRQILQPRLHSSARLLRQSYISPKRDLVNASPSLSPKLIKQEHLVRCVSITHVRVDVSQNFQLVPDDRNV